MLTAPSCSPARRRWAAQTRGDRTRQHGRRDEQAHDLPVARVVGVSAPPWRLHGDFRCPITLADDPPERVHGRATIESGRRGPGGVFGGNSGVGEAWTLSAAENTECAPKPGGDCFVWLHVAAWRAAKTWLGGQAKTRLDLTACKGQAPLGLAIPGSSSWTRRRRADGLHPSGRFPVPALLLQAKMSRWERRMEDCACQTFFFFLRFFFAQARRDHIGDRG